MFLTFHYSRTSKSQIIPELKLNQKIIYLVDCLSLAYNRALPICNNLYFPRFQIIHFVKYFVNQDSSNICTQIILFPL